MEDAAQHDHRNAAPGRRALAAAAVLCVLAAALVFTGWHAALTSHHLVALSERHDRSKALGLQPAPVIQRQFALDTYMWNVLAAEWDTASGQGVTFTHFDNAPDGRPVLWNPAYTGYLRALGNMRGRLAPGESITAAVFRASLWSNWLLLAAGMTSFALIWRRRLGAAGAVALIAAMVFTPGFYEVFLPGYADHHAPLLLLLLGMIGTLAASGPGREPGSPQRTATTAAVASALCGAAAMSMSALSTAIMLAATGIAALACLLPPMRGNDDDGVAFRPGFWRLWGIVGAGATLLLYAFLFMGRSGFRQIEVIHPLYALAWWGGAEFLEQATRLARGSEARGWRAVPRLVPPALAVLALPAVFFVLGAEAHVARDPFHAAIAKHIVELQPLTARFAAGTLDWRGAFGPAPALAALGIGLLFARKRLGPPKRRVIVFLLVMLAAVTAAQVCQTRWGILAAPVVVLLAAWSFSAAFKVLAGFLPKNAAALACLGAGALVFSVLGDQSARRDIARHSDPRRPLLPAYHELYPLMMRDIATILRHNSGGSPPVVLASPTASLLIAAFSGGSTLGTLHWENNDGLRKAAKILCAPDDNTAKRLLDAFGVTHVVLIENDLFLDEYRSALLAEEGAHPLPPTQALWPRQALAGHRLPAWAEVVAHPENTFARALGRRVLILRVAGGPPAHPSRPSLR